jgi:hypothetical protein
MITKVPEVLWTIALTMILAGACAEKTRAETTPNDLLEVTQVSGVVSGRGPRG